MRSGSPPFAPVFLLSKIFDDLERGFSRSKADMYRVAVGLEGGIGDRLLWDAYYQYGRTDLLQMVDHNIINANRAFATDAVFAPGSDVPTCRALLNTATQDAAAGCVPVNLLGAGNVTQAGKDYIYEQLREDLELQQHVAAANLQGSIDGVLAGSLSFAFGGEYRVDKIDVTHDPFRFFEDVGSEKTVFSLANLAHLTACFGPAILLRLPVFLRVGG